MSNPFELPQELLHEVIMRTIKIDNLSNEIIRIAFGLELDFAGEEENWRPLNLKEINRFNKFFLESIGSSFRADLLLDIIKDICKSNNASMIKIGDFKGKLINFYKIRNIFAHNLYPKDLKGFTRLESSEPLWPELNKQHKDLFKEIKNFLMENCYKELKLKKK